MGGGLEERSRGNTDVQGVSHSRYGRDPGQRDGALTALYQRTWVREGEAGPSIQILALRRGQQPWRAGGCRSRGRK